MTKAEFRSIAARFRSKTLVHLELGDDDETVKRAEIQANGNVLFRFPNDAPPIRFSHMEWFKLYGQQWDDFKVLKEESDQ